MSCKHIKSCVFLFSTSAISIASFSATAAPVVDGYTMDFGSTGGTIRLNGSGFTRGPDVALYDNFDGRSPGGTVSLSDPIVGRWGSTSNNPRYVIESDGNGGFLARNFDLTSGGKLAQLQALFDRPEREIFYSFSVKVPQGFHFSGASSPDEFSTQSSWKFSWLYSGQKGYGHDDGLFDVTVPTHVGSGNFAVAGNSGGLSYINNGREWWDWGSFNHFGYYMKISDDAETTDSIDWLLRIASAKNNIVRGGDTPRSSYQGTDYQFDRLNFPGWWGNGSGENFSAIYDNVYIAVGENANSRIVASDKENIDSSTKVVTLPPNNWSDEQIELDFTLLPNWKEVYIHVVDSNGKFSDKGIRVCMECPNPIFPSIK